MNTPTQTAAAVWRQLRAEYAEIARLVDDMYSLVEDEGYEDENAPPRLAIYYAAEKALCEAVQPHLVGLSQEVLSALVQRLDGPQAGVLAGNTGALARCLLAPSEPGPTVWDHIGGAQ